MLSFVENLCVLKASLIRCTCGPGRLCGSCAWCTPVTRKKQKHMQILLGNAQWLAGHSNLARPFLLPMSSFCTSRVCDPSQLVMCPSRSFYAALALATVPRNVSWGLSLVEFNPDNADLSAAHPLRFMWIWMQPMMTMDWHLHAFAVITGEASSSYCIVYTDSDPG